MVQLWPPAMSPKTLESWVHDDATAQAIPGMARALQVYCGLIGQLDLDQVRNEELMRPRPIVLNSPDPNLSRMNYVGQSVRDYWVHGNAASLVLARDFRGYPSALGYFPAHAWSVPLNEPDVFYLHGQPVPAADVVHVQRGVDPTNPRRGIGVVEGHLRSLKRVGLQERYEEDALEGAGVPSVVVIAPQKDLTQKQADDAADMWEQRFGGSGRRPGIFANGTSVQTLAWNPSDQELVLSRQLALTDLANIMNLDPYWLGAPGSSHKYQSAGPMFVALMRTSLEPVMQPFEHVWSRRLVPYGSEVKFFRPALTRDDMRTMATWGGPAVVNGLMTVNEWRQQAGLPRSTEPWADQLREPGAVAAEPEEDTPTTELDDELEPTTTEGE